MADGRDFRTKGYLKVGEVLLLEQGRPVKCAYCPRCLDKNASPYAVGVFDTLVKIGIPMLRKPSLEMIRSSVGEQIRGMFQYYNVHLNEGIMERFIAHQIPITPVHSFLVPVGLYQIIGIETHPRFQKITMKTYKPLSGQQGYEIYIYQGGFHPTHIDNVKVVIDPDRMRRDHLNLL